MTNLKFAEVSEIDPAAGKAKVSFIEDGIVSDWLPFLVKSTKSNKHFYLPDVGEHVACMMDECLNKGVIMGAIYSTKNTPGAESGSDVESVEFSDGTYVKYNRSTHEMSINVEGDLVVMCDNASIISDTQITLDAPTVEVDGDLNVTGSVSADVGVSAGIAPVDVGLSTHNHPTAPDGPVSPPTPGT